MDPLSQAVVGALGAQSVSALSKTKKPQWHHPWLATGVGALAGMAPDLDVLIRSAEDPLLFLEFHRQFTHSLAFIPVGALVVALLLHRLLRRRHLFSTLFVWSFAGYATHGFLDAATSYGTQLFWPFSNFRVSWDLISIIDPLFTFPLLVFILAAVFLKTSRFTGIAVAWLVFYFSACHWQNAAAREIQAELQEARSHMTASQSSVKASIFNIVLWKSIYKFEGRYYVDAIWTLPFLGHQVFEGDSVRVFDRSQSFPDLPLDSVPSQDIERFRWFSQNHLALHPDNEKIVGDMRYSFLPHEVAPLWGILVDTSRPNDHVDYITLRTLTPDLRAQFWSMLFRSRNAIHPN